MGLIIGATRPSARFRSITIIERPGLNLRVLSNEQASWQLRQPRQADGRTMSRPCPIERSGFAASCGEPSGEIPRLVLAGMSHAPMDGHGFPVWSSHRFRRSACGAVPERLAIPSVRCLQVALADADVFDTHWNHPSTSAKPVIGIASAPGRSSGIMNARRMTLPKSGLRSASSTR